MEWPTINFTKVIVSVVGAGLAAYHTSTKTAERIWLFAAGQVFTLTTAGLIDHYAPAQLRLFVLLAVSLGGMFLVREYIAYSDAQAKTIVKLALHIIRRRATGDPVGSAPSPTATDLPATGKEREEGGK